MVVNPKRIAREDLDKNSFESNDQSTKGKLQGILIYR
jgi:hypothetical protein